jgi:hypothetical protein
MPAGTTSRTPRTSTPTPDDVTATSDANTYDVGNATGTRAYDNTPLTPLTPSPTTSPTPPTLAPTSLLGHTAHQRQRRHPGRHRRHRGQRTRRHRRHTIPARYHCHHSHHRHHTYQTPTCQSTCHTLQRSTPRWPAAIADSAHIINISYGGRGSRPRCLPNSGHIFHLHGPST